MRAATSWVWVKTNHDDDSLNKDDGGNLGDDHVDAVRPPLYQLEALEREVEPLVRRRLEVRRQRHPLLTLVRTQQTAHIVSCGENDKILKMLRFFFYLL